MPALALNYLSNNRIECSVLPLYDKESSKKRYAKKQIVFSFELVKQFLISVHTQRIELIAKLKQVLLRKRELLARKGFLWLSKYMKADEWDN